MGKVIMAALILLLLAAGCRSEPSEPGTPVTVYVLSEPGDRAALTRHSVPCPEEGLPRETALDGIISGAGGRSPFPPGTAVTEFELKDGTATVVVSEEAAVLTGFALTQARACVVLTLTELDGIDSVILLIEGLISEPVILRASDFVLGSLVLGDTERSITLFFINEASGQPVTVTRTLVVRETDTVDWYLRFMLELMIDGPQTAGLLPALPEGTRLLSVLAEGGGVYAVNFSGEFVLNAESGGISARQTLYCLVRSATAQPGVSAVSLMVDGQPLETYGGIDTSRPLTINDVRQQ